MRNQAWYVVALVGLMGAVRFGLALIGYIDPHWLMTQLGISVAANMQMPYIIRVWAVRDIVLSVLVVFSRQDLIKTLLIACIAIDATDILSAHLSSMAGLFNEAETLSLKLTAVAALVPESLAFVLIIFSKTQNQTRVESETK